MQALGKYVPGMQAFAILPDNHMGWLQISMGSWGNSAVFQVINVSSLPIYGIMEYRALGYDTTNYQRELAWRH